MLGAATAHAFQIETPVSENCHEELTLTAARAAGFPAFVDAPAPTEDQERAMDDLVFSLPQGDVWTLALLIGVRSNDLADNAPTDLHALVHVHDDPKEQPAHCIRRQEDDGAAGDAGALDACRAFIVGELEAGGLLDDDVDLYTSERVRSFFLFRGAYEIALPRFAYRLGRALHTVQDAYSHSMRDADTGAAVHVLNWVDAYGASDYVEAEDGYPHLSTLDECRTMDAHQRMRLDRAEAATRDVIEAIASPASNRRERVLAAVDAALVRRLGCDASNDYCSAPELLEPKDPRTFGCATGKPMSGGALLVVAVLLATARPRRVRGVRTSVLVACALVVLTPTASAQHAEPPVTRLPTLTGPDEANSDHWHLDARLGGSIDNAGVGAMVGAGRTYGRWGFGFLAEWNPWFSYDRVAVRPGVLDAYATVTYRWFEARQLSIGTRVELGSSTLLFELLGVDQFTTGLYFGGALATIRYPLSRCVAITFDPIHFALPAPRPFGLPFYYKQYRATFGIEMRL